MPTDPTPLADILRAQAEQQVRDAARAQFPQCGGEVPYFGAPLSDAWRLAFQRWQATRETSERMERKTSSLG